MKLNYTVNEPVTRVAYSLDGQKNVTVFGNTTLTRLSDGLHSIVVYAWDTAYPRNVGASETINFTIAEPEPFPVVLVAAASVATVGVVVIGLLIYFKKRKN